MFFRAFFTPGLAIHSYLLGDEKTKQCVAIDPTRQVVAYIIQAQNAGYDITGILETHVHADFVSGSKELKHQLNEKPRIYASGMGGKEWIPKYVDESVKDGKEIKIGNLRLKALHTPGHSPEHLMWLCFDDSRNAEKPWFVFSGDCLFVGSVGRPDLLGKRSLDILAPQLYHTLFEVVASLPDFVEFFPSHGEGSLCGKSLQSRTSSTIGYERICNPYLQSESRELWLDKIKADLQPKPPYFQRVKQMNKRGGPLLSELKISEWKEDEKSPSLNQLFLLDVRLPEAFAASHLKGSLNIPASPSFAQWAGWLLPEETSIGLIFDNSHVCSEIVDQVRLMGFDQEIWCIRFEEAILAKSQPLTSFVMMEANELMKLQPSYNPFYIVDVRTPEEWQAGHISGAHSIPLLVLAEAQEGLPKDQTIALICRSGQRASIAASLLEKTGFSVVNILGGMQAWHQAKNRFDCIS